MKRFVRWLTVLWLPSSAAWAQTQPDVKTRIDWPASSVTVLFAPDFSRQRSSPSKPGAESQNLAAITGIRETGKPVEFSAPGGLAGVKVGPESAMASFVEIAEGGVRQSGCLPLPAVLERIKKAAPPAQRRVQGAASDK